MRSRLWLMICLLSVSLLLPCSAFASESERELSLESVRYEQGEQLRASNTPLDVIRNVFYNTRVVVRANAYRLSNLWSVIPYIMISTQWKAALTASIGIVFMWWGARKVIRMLFRSFRKEKINA